VIGTSGFYSKEAVLGALADLPNKGWLLAGLLGALMTAYYTFRLLFVMWFPRKIEEPHGHDSHSHGQHSKAGYYAMAVPLLVLAVFALLLGFKEEYFLEFLGWGKALEVSHHAYLAPLSIVLVFFGIAVAWIEFGRKGATQTGFLSRLPKVEALFSNRWYMDHGLRLFVDRVVYGLFSRFFTLNDRRVVDGSIDGVCRGTVGTGRLLGFLQSGYLQYNLYVTIVILAAMALYFLLGAYF
jgi:NADH-quinone oxidoreductase subunit L